MRHVVALSGGKDSTAMALRLAEVEPRPYIFVCTPTGNEPLEMQEHWQMLQDRLKAPIIRLKPHGGKGLERIILEQKTLPNFRMRFCTRMLKIEPYKEFLAALGECTSYVGIRADEVQREAGDYAVVGQVETDYPMRRWGWRLREVLAYLAEKEITIPKRTDCELCFFQRIGEWWQLWRDNPAMWERGEHFETKTGNTFRTPGRDSWPVSMQAMRLEFEKGWVPRGGAQESLFNLKCRVCRM